MSLKPISILLDKHNKFLFFFQSFSNKEDVWKEAADWFMKKDINQALTVVYRGLAIHKKSKILCSKAIDLELKNVKSETKAQELCAKRIKTIVNSIMQNINDYRFLLEILQTLTHYPFTADIQKSIVEWLLDKHKDEELVWNTIAERDFKGRYLSVILFYTQPRLDLKNKSMHFTATIFICHNGCNRTCTNKFKQYFQLLI